MQKSIQSFFKKTNSVNTVNSAKDQEPVVDSENVKSVNSVNKNIDIETVIQFRPDKDYEFPRSTFGKRERRCQHQWFQDFSWLHYDAKIDKVFCYYCHSHEAKLTAEHNKDPAYISTGFGNWKKAPKKQMSCGFIDLSNRCSSMW